ncbi:MAG TPA: tetratricopeptide repeat protein [Prolixibacteraceae bacterium]|jgi:tetratricopeptide (TPR) repeat protein
MKKISLLIILLTSCPILFAQKGKVAIASNFKEEGKLDKALTAIEEALDGRNPKTESSISWPRSWEVRGEIYQAIFNSKDENFRRLNADPLTAAYESYLKAIQLDDKNKFTNGLKIKMQLLIHDLSTQAITAFNEVNYNKALSSFEQIMAIENNPIYSADSPNAVDTTIIFNAALAAQNASNYDRAIELYKKAASYNYNGARTYELLTASYLSKKDTTGAINSMQEGLKQYPGNADMLVQLINIYRKKNMVDDALKFLDLAISQGASNETFHFVRGILFEQLQNIDEAVKCYEKAIDLKPDYMDAYFNLGIVYYNRGVKQVDVANAVPSNEPQKYDGEKSKADVEFKTALPFLEKALQLNGTDKMTLESLKNVYYRLQMLDKHAEIVEKIKTL